MRVFLTPICPMDADLADRYGLLQLYVEAVEEFETLGHTHQQFIQCVGHDDAAWTVGPKGKALDDRVMQLWCTDAKFVRDFSRTP